MIKVILLCSSDERALENVKFKSEPHVEKEYIYYRGDNDSLDTHRSISNYIMDRKKDDKDNSILVIKEKVDGKVSFMYGTSRIDRMTSLLYLADVSYVYDNRAGTWFIEKYRDDISLEYPTQEDMKRVMADNDFYRDLLNQLNK